MQIVRRSTLKRLLLKGIITTLKAVLKADILEETVYSH